MAVFIYYTSLPASAGIKSKVEWNIQSNTGSAPLSVSVRMLIFSRSLYF